MYHEATACHVTGDLVELLSIFLSVLKSTRPYLQRKGLITALQSFVSCLLINFCDPKPRILSCLVFVFKFKLSIHVITKLLLTKLLFT